MPLVKGNILPVIILLNTLESIQSPNTPDGHAIDTDCLYKEKDHLCIKFGFMINHTHINKNN